MPSHQLAQWRQRFTDRDLTVNVNMSKRQLGQPDLIPTVRELLRRHEVAAEDVSLEITESVIMDDRSNITPVLEQLRGVGVQLAMDNFETGHSSLSFLHRFPINVLYVARPMPAEDVTAFLTESSRVKLSA